MIETDVVVVGAGPIGLTVANLLADQGLKVTLVEKNASTSDEPRAISITDESLRIMEQIGIMGRLAPEMLMDTGARYFGRKGQLLAEVRPASQRLGQPGKSQFDQPVLESLLLDAAGERPSIALRFGTEATSVTEVPGFVQTVLVSAGSSETVRSKWVVACDGGRSPLRSQLGITLEGSTQGEKWIVVDTVNSHLPPEKFAEFHCNGTRPAVVVPGVKGRRRYEFMLLPGEDGEAVIQPESIIKLVEPFHRITEQDIRRAAVYVAHQRIAKSFRQGRVLLVGDAAHLMPPFAGQALNAGVRDASNVAWKIAAAINGGAPDSLLDTYATERRPHAADMVRLSHRIGKVVMSTSPAVTAIRDTVITGSGIVPRAKHWLTSMRFLKQPHFTEGCLLKPAADIPPATAELVGRSLSQPRVTLNDGSVQPLDKLLGSGWSLLRFTGSGGFDVLRLPRVGGPAEPATPVADTGSLFTGIAAGTTLVVRPDRYVAAVVKTGTEARALGELAALVPRLATVFDTVPPTR